MLMPRLPRVTQQRKLRYRIAILAVLVNMQWIGGSVGPFSIGSSILRHSVGECDAYPALRPPRAKWRPSCRPRVSRGRR